ncbi:MAG: TRAP transporter substrate-binding protein [Alphaproteobacteria bacterium]|jgi:TRAP-type C4-dicarboxylate transport system substrate-binding protein|nr:TRAP transporter substrate-binding protein [Alphaproteobacteria bacterium]MDP6515910.1 TRAP transporter substrate-binding protein [Alphaproteobacteria bacterium]
MVKTQVLAGFAGLLALGWASGPAAAEDVTLTLHHLLSSKSLAHSKYLVPWAERVEAQSEGRIKIEIFPAMSLGGKPPELYAQARDGIADLTWTVLGYTPGVFTRTEVFELPFVHENSARVTNLAIQDLYQTYLAEDFTDIKPILIHVHTGQAIHTVEKDIRKVEDLAGMKLRVPTRTGAWIIESWGAEPVGMPVPALAQALSKGVVEGTLIPYEIVLPFKIQQLTKFSIEGPEGFRFGTSVFMFGMNKKRYESLPADLRKVIDDNAMANIAEWIGRVWDESEGPGREITRQSPSTIVTLGDEAMAGFRAKADEVVARWIEEVEAKGIPGREMVAAARAAIARHRK